MSIIVPSYNQGFARSKGESAYPHLWDGLVACYDPSLGPTGGTLYDHAGRALHGTLTGMDLATDWVVGERGWALDFDGSDDRVIVNALANHIAIGSGSIVARALANSLSGGTVGLGALLDVGSSASSANAIGLGAISATQVAMRYRSGSVDATAIFNVSTDVWNHYVGRWDANTVSLWINGVLVHSVSQGSLIGSALNQALIGADAAGTPNQGRWHGPIDSVYAFSRALTPGEIQQLYLEVSPLVLRPRFAGYSSQDTPSDDLEADGSMTLTGDATLEGVMYLEADGSMTLVGDATLNGTGDVNADGSMTLNGDASFVTDADLEADGTLTLTGDASLTAFYSLEASGTFTLSGDADLATQPVVAAGSMTLNGAVTVLGCRRYDGCVGSDFNYAAGAGECADAYAGCADVGDYEYES